jgi:serine/threonine-protein kinase
MRRLGRYELLDEIGRGAMGRVYRARDPAIDRIVALKVLVPDGGLDPDTALDWRRRFQREARAAGRLAHPNIVTIFDAGEDQGRAFLVMEFVSGRTLEAILSGEGPLPPARALAIGEQIAAALDHAHQQGIVHRDIKPANVLVTPGGLAKVADFGIARIARDPTQTGGIWGSPSYMSPEQVCGRALDGRSDVFSLGAVLYELMTGEKPFRAESVAGIAYRIVHEEPAPLCRAGWPLAPGMDAWRAKALAKQPGRRYQTAGELARGLRAAVEGGEPTVPVAATTLLPPPLAGRWAMPGRLALGCLCLAAAAVVAWLGGPLGRPSAPPAPRPAGTAAADAVPTASPAEEGVAASGADPRPAPPAPLRPAGAAPDERKGAEVRAAVPPAPPRTPEVRPARPETGGQVRVEFAGNTVVPTHALETLAADLLPLTQGSAAILLERLRAHYATLGYSHARAALRPAADGTIAIELLEGRIRSLRPVGFPPAERDAVLEALQPVMQAGVVRTQDLAEAARRLADRQIVAEIRVEGEPDAETVELVVERRTFGGASPARRPTAPAADPDAP